MKDLAKGWVIGTPIEPLLRRLTGREQVHFDDSHQYWVDRYRSRRNDSGPGSYGRLAHFKADVLNDFVIREAVNDVIELGCGDGNQLLLASYESYRGYDISSEALTLCREKFSDDPSKSFAHMSDLPGNTADMSMSLDVIYHLVEDHVYDDYMKALFDAANSFVAVYSSNAEGRLTNYKIDHGPHIRHREFTGWVRTYRPEWNLIKTVQNRFPFDPQNREETSFSDFYFFSKSRESV